MIKSLLSIYAIVRNAKIEGSILPKKDAALLAVAPHTHYMDPTILFWAVKKNCGREPRIVLIAKFANSVIKKIFNPIPVKRGTNDQFYRDELDRAIKNGEIVGLFIEESGKNNNLTKVKSGAASIALKYPHLPIYPIAIMNANPNKGFRNLMIHIGTPFTAASLQKKSSVLEKQEITQYLVRELIQLLDLKKTP